MRAGQQLPDSANGNKDFQAIEAIKRLKKTVEKRLKPGPENSVETV